MFCLLHSVWDWIRIRCEAPVTGSETRSHVAMQQELTLTWVVLDTTRPGKLINVWPGDTTASVQAGVVSRHQRLWVEGEGEETARLEKLDKLIDVSLKIELRQHVCTSTKSSKGFKGFKVLLDEPRASWTLAHWNYLARPSCYTLNKVHGVVLSWQLGSA